MENQQTKTGHEWLELMTEEEREEFKKELRLHRSKVSYENFLKSRFSDFAQFFITSFIWQDTVKGHDYFDEIYLRILKQPTMESIELKSTVYKDAVETKTNNRRVLIRKVNITGTQLNAIHLKSLTSEFSKEPGAISILSENEKIKYTLIGISDDGLIALYATLKKYIEKVI